MTLLGSYTSSPLAAALGWTILHSLWQDALAAAVLALLLAVNRSARCRYTAACIALVATLAAFATTFALSLPEPGTVVQTRLPPPQASIPFAGTQAPAISSLTPLAPWLGPFWMAGVLLFYLRQAAGLVAIHRLRSLGIVRPPECWQAEVDRLAARLVIPRSVRLLESALAEVPLVLGHLRPVILLPLDLLGRLPAGQMEAILLHELAHIRRHDYLVNCLQRLVEGLIFYHPAVWWISVVVRREREHCCDDAVVAARGNAHEYALALAALEQHRETGPAPTLAATGGNLVERVRRMLYPQRSNPAWAPILAALALLAALSLTLAAWPAQQPAADRAATTLQRPYMKWLNEDVVYIINDDERTAYLRLTTNEEREHFIHQFWERREAEARGAKDEHYRRIAYANQRFAAGIPGWRTDRGRMYIGYGPPDEIESHPGKAELWLYRNIPGLATNATLTFIDKSGHGDYRLAPGNGRWNPGQ